MNNVVQQFRTKDKKRLNEEFYDMKIITYVRASWMNIFESFPPLKMRLLSGEKARLVTGDWCFVSMIDEIPLVRL